LYRRGHIIQRSVLLAYIFYSLIKYVSTFIYTLLNIIRQFVSIIYYRHIVCRSENPHQYARGCLGVKHRRVGLRSKDLVVIPLCCRVSYRLGSPASESTSILGHSSRLPRTRKVGGRPCNRCFFQPFMNGHVTGFQPRPVWDLCNPKSAQLCSSLMRAISAQALPNSAVRRRRWDALPGRFVI
jgi:hypothetical protein